MRLEIHWSSSAHATAKLCSQRREGGPTVVDVVDSVLNPVQVFRSVHQTRAGFTLNLGYPAYPVETKNRG